MLAPLYGAGLLLVGELAGAHSSCAGSSDRPWSGQGAAGGCARLAGLGACAAAAAAIAVTIAPGRSVIFTAIGAIAVAATLATIAHDARKRLGTGVDANPATDGSTRQ